MHRGIFGLGIALMTVLSACGPAPAASMVTVHFSATRFQQSAQIPNSWLVKAGLTADGSAYWCRTTPEAVDSIQFGVRVVAPQPFHPGSQGVFVQRQIRHVGPIWATVTVRVPNSPSGRRLARQILQSWHISDQGGDSHALS